MRDTLGSHFPCASFEFEARTHTSFGIQGKHRSWHVRFCYDAIETNKAAGALSPVLWRRRMKDSVVALIEAVRLSRLELHCYRDHRVQPPPNGPLSDWSSCFSIQKLGRHCTSSRRKPRSPRLCRSNQKSGWTIDEQDRQVQRTFEIET